MATEDSGSNTTLVVLVVVLIAVLVGVLIFRGLPGSSDDADVEVDLPEPRGGGSGATWVAPSREAEPVLGGGARLAGIVA